MTLEVKQMIAYLPYNVKCVADNWINEETNRPYVGVLAGYEKDTGLITWHPEYNGEHVKLLLRPLSDLTKPITHNGVEFTPINYNSFKENVDHIIDFQNGFAHYKSVKYGIIERFLEWHLDVFGLIEKGLSVDFNTF